MGFFLFIFCLLLFVSVFLGLVIFSIMGTKEWEAAKPTLSEYLSAHPDCKTDRGIRCSNCGSGSIKN